MLENVVESSNLKITSLEGKLKDIEEMYKGQIGLVIDNRQLKAVVYAISGEPPSANNGQ